MLTYLLGPLICLLPRRWRESLPLPASFRWQPAAVTSGFAESAIALAALSRWYASAMTQWTGHAIDSALSGKMGPGVTPEQIGTVAFFVWASHPWTLLLAYATLEGAVRLLAAAFSDQVLATFPLFLVDKALIGPFRRDPSREAMGRSSEGFSSNASTIRERVLRSKLPVVGDELCFRSDRSEEILEINACRRKDEWDPPRIVRYEGTFYRLEFAHTGSGSRPFQYVLRRLSAGVAGRTVLLYSPADAVIKEQR